MSNETQQSTSSVTMDQASVVEALTGGEEEEWMRRVRSVLTHQLDVEILHKWREIRVIEEELERGRQLQTLIEKLVMNGKIGFVKLSSIKLYRLCIWR